MNLMDIIKPWSVRIEIRSTTNFDWKLTYVPGAHGRSEEQLEIASARSVHGNDGLHVFQIVDGVLGAGAGISLYFQQDRSIARHFPKRKLTRLVRLKSCRCQRCWEELKRLNGNCRVGGKIVRGGGAGSNRKRRRCEETLISAWSEDTRWIRHNRTIYSAGGNRGNKNRSTIPRSSTNFDFQTRNGRDKEEKDEKSSSPVWCCKHLRKEESIGTEAWQHSLCFEHGASLAVISWRYGFPFFRQGDHRASVQYAVAEEVVEFEADPVHRPVESPLGVEQRVPLRR